MNESEIKAVAEAMANSDYDNPGEFHFQQAEREVRQMLANGAVYTEDEGWTWPNGVTLDLRIENHYDGGKVRTRATITVPPPPDNEDDLTDWEGQYIFPATGTGETEGDSAYFVEVVASSDPAVIPVGTEYEFGL